MALSIQPYKGARDFYPEEKRLQKYLFKKMRDVVEKYGYEEYDAPILEPLELYLAKTGEEIVTEQTYAFTDRGGRNVVIRPEMTPTVSRMVAAKRQELSYPLRWYSIPNLWRYERPQRGRLREHWQLNVDIFGIAGLEAEHEVMMIADSLMKTYGAKPDMYTIRLNSRMFVDEALYGYLQLDKAQATALVKLIDHMHKMPHAEFVAEADAIFTPTQREAAQNEKLFALLKIADVTRLPDTLKAHDSVQDLNKLMSMLKTSGVDNVQFDMTLMRGFDYYTDIVFEVFDANPQNNRSLFGGGRYDGLVGLFGVDPVPTVGFGMGDVTLANFLELHNLLPKLHTEIDAYVVLVGDMYQKVQPTLTQLRREGLKLAVDTSGRKPAAQIKSAVKKGAYYAIFIGDKELEEDQFTLKNLSTSEEKQMSSERLVSTIKDFRKK